MRAAKCSRISGEAVTAVIVPFRPARRVYRRAIAGLAAAPGGSYVSAAEGAYTVVTHGSGATGSSAASGAETGASVGAFAGPIGIAIGVLVGAAAGALLSAFGGGRRDPETASWNAFIVAYQQTPAIVNQLSAPAAFQMLAGIMDAKNNTPGHSSALELAFGRMAEGTVVVQMADVINAAAAAGKLSATDTPITVYTRIVKPWLISKNAYVKPTDIISSNGSRAGGAVDALFEVLIAAWISGYLKASTPVGISGQRIAGLPPFAGLPARSATATKPVASPVAATVATPPAVGAIVTSAPGVGALPPGLTYAGSDPSGAWVLRDAQGNLYDTAGGQLTPYGAQAASVPQTVSYQPAGGGGATYTLAPAPAAPPAGTTAAIATGAVPSWLWIAGLGLLGAVFFMSKGGEKAAPVAV